MIASRLSGHCNVISNRLWRHQQYVNNKWHTGWMCEDRHFILTYGYVVMCKIMTNCFWHNEALMRSLYGFVLVKHYHKWYDKCFVLPTWWRRAQANDTQIAQVGNMLGASLRAAFACCMPLVLKSQIKRPINISLRYLHTYHRWYSQHTLRNIL